MRVAWVVGVALITAFGACGDGASDAASGDLAEFCDRAAALDALERHPTDEELESLLDVAPGEVQDAVEILVASAREFRAGNEEAADTPEIQHAGNRYDDFIEANC